MEERAKYFPSESIIKKSILSQNYCRGTNATREVREIFTLSRWSGAVRIKRDRSDRSARWD
jgi:hypothetical protein